MINNSQAMALCILEHYKTEGVYRTQCLYCDSPLSEEGLYLADHTLNCIVSIAHDELEEFSQGWGMLISRVEKALGISASFVEKE